MTLSLLNKCPSFFLQKTYSFHGYSIIRKASGFTLAELLICLQILAVIATFTIPKIITSQQDSRYRAIVKENAAMVAAAYQIYRSKNQVTATTKFTDLTPYLNYVSLDTGGVNQVDDLQGQGTITCNNVNLCLRLHNGSVLIHYPTMAFGGTATTNGVWFNLDPDGTVSNGGNGKSIQIWIYYSGRVTTLGTIDNNSCWSDGCDATPLPALDPPWFSWK